MARSHAKGRRRHMIPQSTVRAPELKSIVLEVLGDLAFMITDDEPVHSPSDSDWISGEVSYRGPTAGTVRCCCTRALAIQLAANLLGIEVDECPAQTAAEDALREFLNVLCGQLVTRWYGRSAVFDLSIPSVQVGVPAPTVAGETGSNTCRLSVEGQLLLCSIQQDESGRSQ
jgi:hypothetical protein